MQIRNCQKIRQINASSAIPRKNVNKLSRMFSFVFCDFAVCYTASQPFQKLSVCYLRIQMSSMTVAFRWVIRVLLHFTDSILKRQKSLR